MLRSICRICFNGVTGTRNRFLNLIDTPILVLIYHRVTTLSSDPQLLAVSPDNFLNHMLYIKDNFQVLRFEDDWSKITEPSVVITFDDGYADNVREALPLLEKVGVPATFFVSTGGLGSNREFWWDELERIILEGEVFPDSFELRDARFGGSWPTRNSMERSALYQEIHPLIKQIDVVRRECWFNQLREWVDVVEEGRATHRVMTINELQKLAASGLTTIGAHTVSHTPLATLSSAEQLREIVESKRQLEELTGQKISVFSYPFGGKSDYSCETVRLCRKAGYIRTASNFSGQVHHWTDPHQIPRNLVRNWPVEMFQLKIKEFWYR
jgi:peptidoglycan/xylan/chitin deacetylase (PgdA/CDA1 family)